MLQLLQELRHKVAIGFVGGSDLAKQQEQLGSTGENGTRKSTPHADKSHRLVRLLFCREWTYGVQTGRKVGFADIHQSPGRGKVPRIGQFLSPLHCRLENPRKKVCACRIRFVWELMGRGTFVEFRTGMINVSPIGRNCSSDERNAYEKFDKEHHIREKMIEEIHKKFPDIGLTYSIGNNPVFYVCRLGCRGAYFDDRWANLVRLFPHGLG
jgi:phosphomannomutase